MSNFYRDLLYNIVPIVSNAVLGTSKFVKSIDLRLSVLNTIKNGPRETERYWMSIILTVVMVSPVFAYVQTHPIVH